MTMGKNLRGGLNSWETMMIKKFGEEGGGVPLFEVAVIADNGEIIVWLPTGEVYTAAPPAIITLEQGK
jgi:hypothetical protein